MLHGIALKARALSDTCIVETGTVISPTTTTVSCLAVPPKSSTDDSLLTFIVEDTAMTYVIGIRVVFHSTRYLITQVEYDRETGFSRLHGKSWQESMT